MTQTTLKEFSNTEVIYIDSGVIFSHIKTLVNELEQNNKKLIEKNINKDINYSLLTNLNKKYLLLITDLVEKEVLINLVKSKKEDGCDLSLKKANFIFACIFKKFRFIQNNILDTFKFEASFFDFCLKHKISIVDAIHVLAAINRHIKIATSDKKLRYNKHSKLRIFKPQDLLN